MQMDPKKKIANDYKHPIWQKSIDNRLRAVDRYLAEIGGLPKTAKVLDFGAGHGAFSQHLAKRGHYVIPIDARTESIELMKKDYGLTGIQCDLDKDFPKVDGKGYFSMVIGIIYHLEHPQHLLEKVAAVSDHVVIESVCLDHDGAAIVRVDEDPGVVGFAINGVGCRPSPNWIIQNMKRFGFGKCVDLCTSDMNIPAHEGNSGNLYTWEYQRTCGWRRDEMQLRKMYGFARTK